MSQNLWKTFHLIYELNKRERSSREVRRVPEFHSVGTPESQILMEVLVTVVRWDFFCATWEGDEATTCWGITGTVISENVQFD